MIVFLFIAFIILALYIIAKILIPILVVILKFSVLIAAISPFVVFSTIGFLLGKIPGKTRKNSSK